MGIRLLTDGSIAGFVGLTVAGVEIGLELHTYYNSTTLFLVLTCARSRTCNVTSHLAITADFFNKPVGVLLRTSHAGR